MNRLCVALLLALLGASAQDAAAAPPRSTSASTPALSAKPKTKKRATSGTAQRHSAGTSSRSTRKPTGSRATPTPAAGAKTGAKPAAPAPELLAEPELATAPTERGPSGANEVRVQPAGEQPAAAVVKTETADKDKGVKTYTFGAQEVEGRLRSPQILYFLRRVRAEFDAGPLGHRSFLLELSDTRRHSALR
jgi:hypothetical protein